MKPLKKFTTDGIMLVGDAAHQINMPHVAGVLHAMDAGVMAGETAVDAHEEGDFSYNVLSRYEKRWYKLHGEKDAIGFYLTKVGYTMSPKQINTIFHILKDNNAVFVDKIFETLFKSPKFVSELIRSFREEEKLKIEDVLSLSSLIRKHYATFWDTFTE